MPRPKPPRGDPQDYSFKQESRAQKIQYKGQENDVGGIQYPITKTGDTYGPGSLPRFLQQNTDNPDYGTVYAPPPETYVDLKNHLAAVGAMTYMQRLGMTGEGNMLENFPELSNKLARLGDKRIPMRQMRVLGGIARSTKKNERRNKNAKESD